MKYKSDTRLVELGYMKTGSGFGNSGGRGRGGRVSGGCPTSHDVERSVRERLGDGSQDRAVESHSSVSSR